MTFCANLSLTKELSFIVRNIERISGKHCERDHIHFNRATTDTRSASLRTF